MGFTAPSACFCFERGAKHIDESVTIHVGLSRWQQRHNWEKPESAEPKATLQFAVPIFPFRA